MADSSAMADLRGLQIDKLAKGFADEENVFKQFLTNSTTSAREIRWFQKTSGFLDSPDTTAITASQIANTSSKSQPVVVEQTWTRNTSYVRKYFVTSPLISDEDIKDSDVDIFVTLTRDLTRAVQRQIDARIYTVLSTGTGVQTGASTQDGWDDLSTGNPILDILNMKQAIRSYGYNPEGAILVINSIEHKNLINYLISVKGSSIPQFASQTLGSGVVQELLGVKVVVSENATTDQALLFVPQRAATWKTFTEISSAVVDEPLIGKRIRIAEEGEILLTDPKACYLLTDTVV